ncbi:hypothetical protein [Shimia sp.]|jgi:hypothetical protein|uniref:hypothetical protein n=1 Tax=unclassified Shimia TaxID=2630038 RepID=UPI0025F107CA|nr:hypothetical protein [Shimia sp.]MCH2067636.1 hypothetical protein [Shimia sp.]
MSAVKTTSLSATRSISVIVAAALSIFGQSVEAETKLKKARLSSLVTPFIKVCGQYPSYKDSESTLKSIGYKSDGNGDFFLPGFDVRFSVEKNRKCEMRARYDGTPHRADRDFRPEQAVSCKDGNAIVVTRTIENYRGPEPNFFRAAVSPDQTAHIRRKCPIASTS